MPKSKRRKKLARKRKSSLKPKPPPPLPPPSGDYNQALITYAVEGSRFSKEVEKSKREFWEDKIPHVTFRRALDPGMVFWIDWFIYFRPLASGLTPLQDFIRVYQGHLPPEDEAAYRKLEESVLGFFEVQEVQRNRSVTVRDLYDGQVYEVTEKRATHKIKVGHVFCAHILPLPDGYRFTGALVRWLESLKDYIPGYLDELIARGKGPRSRGYVPALDRARRSVYLEDSDLDILGQVAMWYQFGRTGWNRALEVLRPILETEPFNPVANFYYGLMIPDDLAETERRLRMTQVIVPDFTGGWGESIDSHLVSVLEAQDKYDEAIETYRRMMHQDPKDMTNYLNLGNLLTRLGRVNEAEELYREEIRRFRDDHTGHYCLGLLYQRQERHEEAREQHTLALQKAYWQLQRWPGCIDETIIEEMEDALRGVGGDPARVPPYKRRLWRRRKPD